MKNGGTKINGGQSDGVTRKHAFESSKALLRPLYFVYLVNDYGEGLASSDSAAIVPDFSAPLYHLFNLIPIFFLRLNILLAVICVFLSGGADGLCLAGVCDVLLL